MDSIKELATTIFLDASYSGKLVTTKPIKVDIAIPLVGGEGSVTTIPFELGQMSNFGNPLLMGSLTIWYRYETDTNCLTLCSSDLVSENTSYITSYPEKTSNTSVQRGHFCTQDKESKNDFWDHSSSLHQGLDDVLRDCVRSADLAIAKNAINNKINVTLESKVPAMTPELYASLCPVYKNGKFLEFFDPGKVYGDDCIIKEFSSIYTGPTTLVSNVAFSNVKGSSDDPKPDKKKSWMDLWRSVYGEPVNPCASYSFACEEGQSPVPFTCTAGKSLCGGHIILGQQALEIPANSNDVIIIPICSAHNNKKNDKYYMQAIKETRACALGNYLQL